MRNPSIDVLRGIGLLMVILAHVGPCGFVYEFRSFDVVLMVFVSGLTFSMKSEFNYWEYIKKRTMRLLVPTYIFLSTYFLLIWLITGQHVSVTTALLSYTLIGGIGYVWIIRIFLLIMIVAPLLYKLTIRMPKVKFMLLMLGFFVTSDCLSAISFQLPSVIQKSLEIVVIPIVGYSIPYCMALRIRESKDTRAMILFLSLMFCIGLSLYAYMGEPVLVHLYKTPPRTIYLTYGLLASMLFYYAVNTQWFSKMTKLQWGGAMVRPKYNMDILLAHSVC